MILNLREDNFPPNLTIKYISPIDSKYCFNSLNLSFNNKREKMNKHYSLSLGNTINSHTTLSIVVEMLNQPTQFKLQ